MNISMYFKMMFFTYQTVLLGRGYDDWTKKKKNRIADYTYNAD